MPNEAPIFLSLHAAALSGAVALCASVALPADGAPDWVHLLPAGEIRTGDGRGPYRVVDVAKLVSTSLQAGDRLPIDENHATDLAAPRGEPAPARGWIVALQGREDGLWGQVEWTAQGRRLVASKAYRGISPVINHLADGTVTAVLRASLVNKPNLRGLTALHQENHMDLLAKLVAALGLPATTTEDAALTAVTALHASQAASATALQSALGPIAQAVGLQAGADAGAVLAGVQRLKGVAAKPETIVALQAELTDVTTKFTALQAQLATDKAIAFVDGAIKAGRVGVRPLREHYVAMHAQDPARVEKEIGALPILGSGGVVQPSIVPPANGEVALQAEHKTAAKLLGIPEKDYAATLKGEREAAL